MTIKRKGATKGEIVKTMNGILSTQARIIEWIEFLANRMDVLDNIMGSYIEMRGGSKDLKKFIDKEKKKIELAKKKEEDGEHKQPKRKRSGRSTTTSK